MKKKDLQALWGQLTQGAEGEDADIPDATIAEALQKQAHPVFQIIYDRGHGAATKTAEEKAAELTTKISTLETNHRTAQEQLEAERKKHPDTEQLREQYEERERQLREAHDTEKAALQTQLSTERRNVAKQTLKSLLRSGDRVLDSDYADVLIDKQATDERINFREDGSVEVFQAGKQIALAPAEGVSPLELLAKELKEQAPSKFVEVRTDRGAGARGDGGGGTGGGGGFFNDYRKSLEEERKTSTQVADATSEAKKRLGVS